jgi:hypothetical protein
LIKFREDSRRIVNRSFLSIWSFAFLSLSLALPSPPPYGEINTNDLTNGEESVAQASPPLNESELDDFEFGLNLPFGMPFDAEYVAEHDTSIQDFDETVGELPVAVAETNKNSKKVVTNDFNNNMTEEDARAKPKTATRRRFPRLEHHSALKLYSTPSSSTLPSKPRNKKVMTIIKGSYR